MTQYTGHSLAMCSTNVNMLDKHAWPRPQLWQVSHPAMMYGNCCGPIVVQQMKLRQHVCYTFDKGVLKGLLKDTALG